MKTLALLILLASPCLAASTGTVASAQARLAHDPAGALADADAAIARGGGADAYAARADAQLALGRPLDRVIEDYGKAAKLDSAYLERYEGLIAQRDSETNPKARFKTGGVSLGNVADSLAMILAAAAVSWLILVVALVMLKGRETRSRASDDEQAGPNKPS